MTMRREDSALYSVRRFLYASSTQGALGACFFIYIFQFLSSFFESIPYVFGTYRPAFYNRADFSFMLFFRGN